MPSDQHDSSHKSLIVRQKNCIVMLLASDLNSTSIAFIKNVSVWVVCKIHVIIQIWDEHIMKALQRSEQIKKLTSFMLKALQLYFHEYSYKFQDELQIFLFNEFNVWISQAVISKDLKKKWISKKVMKQQVLKQSKLCCNMYREKISFYTTDQIVAINKSAASEHTCYYCCEWDSFNIISHVYCFLQQSECRSILSVYIIDEVLCYLI